MRLPNQIVPIYIVSGFLDSGKTTIIRNMLEDEGFSRGQKTLIVLCEEGMEELDETALAKQNAKVHTVDSVEDMTPSLFVDLNKQYKPERVIIEYNSVWGIENLFRIKKPLACRRRAFSYSPNISSRISAAIPTSSLQGRF